LAGETKLPDPVDSIPANARAILNAALKEKNIDLNLYVVEYFQDNKVYSIGVYYKKKAVDLLGSDPDYPDYEVLIQRSPIKLLRISIAR